MRNHRHTTRRCIARVGLLLVPLLAIRAHASPGPWLRTETREPCANADLFRQPFFGDTHVHTSYSADAVFAGTRENPRGAYRFAQGQAIGLPPFDAMGQPTRMAQLRRPLDFTAVTDHSEGFGEIHICLTPGYPGYNSTDCVSARNQLATPPPALPNMLPPIVVIAFLFPYGNTPSPTRFSWCGPGNADCLAGIAGLARHAGGGRGVLRPHGGVHLHQLRRVRVERPAGRQQPAPERHL